MAETLSHDNLNNATTPVEDYAALLGGEVLAAAAHTDGEYARFLEKEMIANARVTAIGHNPKFTKADTQVAINYAVHRRNARRLYEQKILGIPPSQPEGQ